MKRARTQATVTPTTLRVVAVCVMGAASTIGCQTPPASRPVSAPAPAPATHPAERKAQPAPTRSMRQTALASPATQSVAPDAKQPAHVTTPLPPIAPMDELTAKPLYDFNEREIDVYLRHLRKAEPDPRKRVMHLARKNIGQPYQLFLLGEYPFEIYDPDPMYCLQKSDCVTFSEHTYAMALGHDWASFFALLQRLRYRDGKVGMLTRNHETVVDWDRNNAWLFEDITRTLGGGKAFTEMHGEWQPAKFFAQFGIGQDLPDVKFTDVYIPRAKIASVEPELKDGDFVNIVIGNEKAQLVGHTGLIGHGPDGSVHFIHSTKPQVREETLQAYLTRNTSVLGIKFLRLREDAQAIADRRLEK